jgi:hypothetical protein
MSSTQSVQAILVKSQLMQLQEQSVDPYFVARLALLEEMVDGLIHQGRLHRSLR